MGTFSVCCRWLYTHLRAQQWTELTCNSHVLREPRKPRNQFCLLFVRNHLTLKSRGSFYLFFRVFRGPLSQLQDKSPVGIIGAVLLVFLFS
jgi:hypothetical protein